MRRASLVWIEDRSRPWDMNSDRSSSYSLMHTHSYLPASYSVKFVHVWFLLIEFSSYWMWNGLLSFSIVILKEGPRDGLTLGRAGILLHSCSFLCLSMFDRAGVLLGSCASPSPFPVMPINNFLPRYFPSFLLSCRSGSSQSLSPSLSINFQPRPSCYFLSSSHLLQLISYLLSLSSFN